jgi:hypothetical protein
MLEIVWVHKIIEQILNNFFYTYRVQQLIKIKIKF